MSSWSVMRLSPFAGSTAPIAAFVTITQTAGGTGQNPERQRRAAAQAEDGRGAAILLRDAKRAIAPYNVRPFGGAAENSRTSAIVGPGRLPSERPLEARGRGPRRHWMPATDLLTSMEGKRSYPSAVAGKRKRSTSSGAS